MAIAVLVGGEAIEIDPTQESVESVLACAYLVGGFELVLQLAQAVEDCAATAAAAMADLRRVRSRITELVSRSRSRMELEQLLQPSSAELASADARRRDALEVQSLVRSAWTQFASAEEAVLSLWERRLVQEFCAMSSEAEDIAQAEWERYEPHDPAGAAAATLEPEQARELGIARLELRVERKELLDAVWRLHAAALALLYQREDIRRDADIEAARRNSPRDPYRALAAAEAAGRRRRVEFEHLRSELGAKHPIALQVYGQLKRTWEWQPSMRTDARDREVVAWIVEAMLQTLDAAPRLRADARAAAILREGTQLRKSAAVVADMLASFQPGGNPEAQAASATEKAAARLGLDVPASHEVALKLQDAGFAMRSAWLVFPVRYRLRQRALGESGAGARRVPADAELAPYFEPARLHQAALASVYRGLQEERERRDAAGRRMLLAMDVLAVPLAFFTAGGSLAIAGAVHAALRAGEMGAQYQEFLAREELASLSYSMVSECILEHPSRLLLAGKLIQGGFDIASDLAPGRAGAALAAVQTVLSIGYGAEAVARWAEAGD